MDDPRILGPIPTPPAQRWREIRLLYLPRITFVVGLLVAGWLWVSSVAPATMVGEAEVQQVEVRAAQAGVLASLKVEMLQTVRAGEVVGHVAQANPRLLDATLAVIRADVAMLSATMAGATDRQKNAIEFEKMQVDWLSRRVDLAALRGRLQQAESQLSRNEPLHKAGLISDENYEQMKTDRQAVASQVEEQSRLVAQMEPIVRSLAPRDEKDSGLSPEAALLAAIKVQDAKLKLAEEQLMPLPLIAPIDGVVSDIKRRPGENLSAGDVVVLITDPRVQRITGFLRQPLSLEPKVGMVAEVQTRGAVRRSATSKVTEVGAALESLPASIVAALHLPASPAPESALRVQLAVPKGLVLRPGEHVDVTLR